MSEPIRRQRQKCQRCGNTHRSSKYDKCRNCRSYENAQYRDHELALTGGQWVVRGGIRVWTGDPQPEHDRTDELMAAIATNLAETAPEFIVNKKETEPTFCECGCWLLSADEDCPACLSRVEWLPWALKVEAEHNREMFGRAA